MYSRCHHSDVLLGIQIPAQKNTQQNSQDRSDEFIYKPSRKNTVINSRFQQEQRN